MVCFQGIQERRESGVGISKETRFDAVSRRAQCPTQSALSGVRLLARSGLLELAS